MKGLENLVLARRSAPPKGAGAEVESPSSQEASAVPAVDIVNDTQPVEPAPSEVGRRSVQNTRMNGSPSGQAYPAEPQAPEAAPPAPQGGWPQEGPEAQAPRPASQDAASRGFSAPTHAENLFVDDRQTPAPLAQKAVEMLERTPQGQHAVPPAPYTPEVAMAPPAPAPVPPAPTPMAPADAQAGSAKRRSTRLLGFSAVEATPDVFASEPAAAPLPETRYPIGWLVVLEGPGLGMSYTLTSGLTTIGRAENQTVSLDFGDDSISREQHVAIAYDEDENRTYVGHGGKRNIVRLNGKPLLTTEELADGDHLRIGKTTLYFVSLCNGEFAWKNVMEPEDQPAGHNG